MALNTLCIPGLGLQGLLRGQQGRDHPNFWRENVPERMGYRREGMSPSLSQLILLD